MTRKEQVLQDKNVPECYIDRARGYVHEAFMDGVHWADEHPEQISIKSLKSLYLTNMYIQGARAMLLRLIDDDLIHAPRRDKDGEVYAKATIDMVLKSIDNMILYLYENEYRYRNHEHDKKGKVVKCEAYFIHK